MEIYFRTRHRRKWRVSGSWAGGGRYVSTCNPRSALSNAKNQRYEKERKWIYEAHPFWCTGFTFWDLHKEAPDLFLHLSRSDLVIFKGDLNHRKASFTSLLTSHPTLTRFIAYLRLCGSSQYHL